jgi:hypothetical protein
MEVGEMYDVTWSGYGDTAVAYVSGPGVDFLRLGTSDLDTGGIAAALDAAYAAGKAQVWADLDAKFEEVRKQVAP